MNEELTLDPNRNYLIEEPFFIVDPKTTEAHILRMVNVDPLTGRTIKNG